MIVALRGAAMQKWIGVNFTLIDPEGRISNLAWVGVNYS